MDFIEMLRKMNVKEIFVGKDFRYGAKAKGTISTLKDYFDVYDIDIKEVDGEKISAQEIGGLISNGEIEKANDLLGHNYCVTGSLVSGNPIRTT